MINLTDRLQVLADQIEEQETMADIGTDHGFLPIALWERHICPHVILTDVSSGSLEKARQTGQASHPNKIFDLRLGSGLRVLEKGEVDVVVIAGMGGILMTQILGEDLEKASSFGKLVLQPRSGQGKLRHWLVHHDFQIIKESLVREGKYICEVLTVVPCAPSMPSALSAEPLAARANVSREMPGKGPEDIEYEVPPWILSAGELAEPFMRRKLAAEQRVWEGLLKSKQPDRSKEKRTRERMAYLKSLLGGV